MEWGELLYKKVSCLHDAISILQHFDSECDWMNFFESRDIIIVKKEV